MKISVENNSRIAYIDNAKGILILCIVLGHIYTEGGYINCSMFFMSLPFL